MSNGVSRVNGLRPTWRDKLQDHCRISQYQAPVFNLVSDRRGGRTAWSSTVTVQGVVYYARYFYDGQYIDNAKEDAAEVALLALNSQQRPAAATGFPGQLYAQTPAAAPYRPAWP